jgi:hypothetical protein
VRRADTTWDVQPKVVSSVVDEVNIGEHMAVAWVGVDPSAHYWVFNTFLERLTPGIASRKERDQSLEGKRTSVLNLTSKLALKMAGT